ncbi:Miniconductance mechanosensitive channel MscM [Candidatus Erwinia haradaeae]|uniref:Miniconductance mechanosensitive channel MscM, partial n=1 Tax=Candidatus Erwinia haradaeae TaxID=1922217 RepID=A0A451CZR8_9GAMM|nr:miniconductance mechanosensitive channel MscM [Candidatus Erwinia haradaeae]VFP78797.1 Miniconductance mechanosensitive channel MscM [Candidatus Erwinia haradaeae]
MLRLLLIIFLLGGITQLLNIFVAIDVAQIRSVCKEENYSHIYTNPKRINNYPFHIKEDQCCLYNRYLNYSQEPKDIDISFFWRYRDYLSTILVTPTRLIKSGFYIIQKSRKKVVLESSSQNIDMFWKTQIKRSEFWNIGVYLLNLFSYPIEIINNLKIIDHVWKILFFSVSNQKLHEEEKSKEFLRYFFQLNSSKLYPVLSSNYACLETVSVNTYLSKVDSFNVKTVQLCTLQDYNIRNVVGQKLVFIGQFPKDHYNIPDSISSQLDLNRELLSELKKQRVRMEMVLAQQHVVANQIIQVREALNTISEQSQWLSMSNSLGEALRSLVARLPKMPKTHQFNSEMAELRAKRLYYIELLGKQSLLLEKDYSFLTKDLKNIFITQLKMQNKILTSLISGSDILALELTKLNVSNTHLVDALKKVKDASHRYLFWSADVSSLNFRYPIELVYDLKKLLSLDTLGQLSRAIIMMCTTRDTVILLFSSSLLVSFSIGSHPHFCSFLDRASKKVGKVTQDQFSLTMRTVFWSILFALPLPVFFAVLGYGLQRSWPYSIAVAIGYGVTASVPLLWGFMVCNTFAHNKGLFIVHFRWPRDRVALAMRFYRLCIGAVVPLMMMLISFENLSDREFSPTLGRFCFILICGALSLVTVSFKHAGIPLYLDKDGNRKNVINNILWNIMLSIPIAAAIASCVGYLETSKALLARLETSLAIWFLLLVMYYIIRRWMLIQRRRIAFDRARARRADILAHRARNEEELGIQQGIYDNIEIDEPGIDLDAISAQSLRLVRSFLTLVALVSVILLWSEIHSAFSFLENIRLWDVSTTIHGAKKPQPITVGSVMNTALVLIITTQLVRNMPALLELALLQHLSLNPGTGYAIKTLTKYLIVLIGSLTGFTLIGIDWSKLQWLVAGLSVGLGFGLQEIFANFISGLILLFEKPIRIGDTVTIRDLTGSITRINTRATTITDWDHKEIIMPNKSFLTEQFINWSLSDSVTRVVLNISVSLDSNSEEVTQVLLQAAKGCRYVLENPYPEAFLVDLQKGIQLFELRIYAAEMNHRMLLRHELHRRILLGFQEIGIEIPFPIFQIL